MVRRDGEELEYAVQTMVPEAGKGMIGVAAPVQKTFCRFPCDQPERFGDVISMYHVITGQAPFDVIGPVGIIITVGECGAPVLSTRSG